MHLTIKHVWEFYKSLFIIVINYWPQTLAILCIYIIGYELLPTWTKFMIIMFLTFIFCITFVNFHNSFFAKTLPTNNISLFLRYGLLEWVKLVEEIMRFLSYIYWYTVVIGFLICLFFYPFLLSVTQLAVFPIFMLLVWIAYNYF